MSSTYDKQKKIYDNKKSYIGLYVLLIVVALIAIYFVWSTETTPEVQTRIVYRTPQPTVPTGYYDAYDK